MAKSRKCTKCLQKKIARGLPVVNPRMVELVHLVVLLVLLAVLRVHEEVEEPKGPASPLRGRWNDGVAIKLYIISYILYLIYSI